MISVGCQRRDGPGRKATTSHDVGLLGPRRASNGMIGAIVECAASRTYGFESVVRREPHSKRLNPANKDAVTVKHCPSPPCPGASGAALTRMRGAAPRPARGP